MKCKHSMGDCHVWTGELKKGETYDTYVANCKGCWRNSGNKTFKEQFKDLYLWAWRAYNDPTIIERKQFYLGFSEGVKTILNTLGDDYDVYSKSDKE